MLKPIAEYECLVLGCGNPLIGDDGFGPAVIHHLEKHYFLPDFVAAIDCGTSIRDILFDLLLSPQKPRKMIIVDVTDSPNLAVGEIREIDIDQIQPEKIGDFSLHQFPTTNMLKEIKEETSIDVRIFVVQVAGLPAEVKPGLSEPVRSAIAPSRAPRFLPCPVRRRLLVNRRGRSLRAQRRMRGAASQHEQFGHCPRSNRRAISSHGRHYQITPRLLSGTSAHLTVVLEASLIGWSVRAGLAVSLLDDHVALHLPLPAGRAHVQPCRLASCGGLVVELVGLAHGNRLVMRARRRIRPSVQARHPWRPVSTSPALQTSEATR